MAHLFGDKIALREYQLSDLDRIRQWVNDPEITNTLSDVFLYPHSQNESESFLNMMMEGKPHKCYLKCGFKEEGRMRQKLFKNGRYNDVIKMAILKEEYEER